MPYNIGVKKIVRTCEGQLCGVHPPEENYYKVIIRFGFLACPTRIGGPS